MVYRRGTVWYVQLVDARGKRVRTATDCRTKAQAEALESELKVREERRRLGLEPMDRNPERLTVAGLVEWYLTQTTATANHIHLGHTLRAHVVGPFADLRLQDVDGPAVRAFLVAFAKTPSKKGTVPSPSSVNRLRAYLSGMFSAARDAGIILGDNPVKATRLVRTEAPVPRPLPAELILPIIEYASPAWRLPIAIAAYAGLRLSEVARLKWADIDLVEGVIYVRTTKAKKARVVPIHVELLAMLTEAKAAGVMPTCNRGRAADAVRSAIKAAGLTVPADADDCFKALRTTWASRWVACGCPPPTVEWVGWGPRGGSVMQRHYLQWPVAVLRAEMAKLSWPAATTATVLKLKGGAQ